MIPTPTPKGSFISLPLPLTVEEIQHQLFEVVHRFNFKPDDDIYLSFINDKYNFRLFFNNYGFIDGTTYIGWYPYCDFKKIKKKLWSLL